MYLFPFNNSSEKKNETISLFLELKTRSSKVITTLLTTNTYIPGRHAHKLPVQNHQSYYPFRDEEIVTHLYYPAYSILSFIS